MSTKTCSNNMVSPNDHVVMNHQNQTPNKWHMRPCSLQRGSLGVGDVVQNVSLDVHPRSRCTFEDVLIPL
jgi:hypothetical protein